MWSWSMCGRRHVTQGAMRRRYFRPATAALGQVEVAGRRGAPTIHRQCVSNASSAAIHRRTTTRHQREAKMRDHMANTVTRTARACRMRRSGVASASTTGPRSGSAMSNGFGRSPSSNESRRFPAADHNADNRSLNGLLSWTDPGGYRLTNAPARVAQGTSGDADFQCGKASANAANIAEEQAMRD